MKDNIIFPVGGGMGIVGGFGGIGIGIAGMTTAGTVVGSAVAISPDGKTFASGSLDKTVKLWDLTTGNLLQTIQASSPVIFSDNGKYLITVNSKNQIEIWQKLKVLY